MAASYLNPWYRPGGDGPRIFNTEAKAIEHRGFLIFQRIPRSFEVVKNGVCLTQRAGLFGAKSAIDNLLDNASDYWAQRMAGYMGLAQGGAA